MSNIEDKELSELLEGVEIEKANLSEEERKKAYEFLQELEKNGYRYTADGREMYIVENVFNKIDRLQKELEQEKKKNKMLKDLIKHAQEDVKIWKDLYDKVKEENEELKEQRDNAIKLRNELIEEQKITCISKDKIIKALYKDRNCLVYGYKHAFDSLYNEIKSLL